jgi:hypothetical protein
MSMTLSLEVLSKYPNRTFIETGTNIGGGVQVALNAGFERIVSIEINENLFAHSRNRFRGNDKVAIVLGDSTALLWNVIKGINHEITFWLDGHTAYENIPILKELKIISMHHIKTHTIIVDDRRAMGNPMWLGVTEKQVIRSMKKINKNYKISYEQTIEQSAHGQEDIIVAHI